jgi:predicted nuclease of predicted toxin-antitoxin system
MRTWRHDSSDSLLICSLTLCTCGSAGPDDEAIWTFARGNDFAIVSKDSDFYGLSVVRGAPPKVVWLRVGNLDTAAIAAVLRTREKDLQDFAGDPNASLLILGRP